MDSKGFDEQLFSEFFGEQPQAIVWLKPVWDAKGNTITDFEYVYSNAEGYNYLGVDKEHIRGLMLSVTTTVDDVLRKRILHDLANVYQTGQKSETKIYNPALNKYAKVLRVKFRDGVLTIAQNMTEENNVIQRLQQEKNFSNSILNASFNGFFAAKAVRNDNGEIVDFFIQQINPAFTQQLSLTEEEVIGKKFLTLFPATKKAGVFDMHKRVCESGHSESADIHFQQDQLDAWFHIVSVKFNDGVLVTFTDITEQKKATETIEQQRNLLANIMDHSPVGISVTEVIRDEKDNVVNGRTIIANDMAAAFIQIPMDIYLSKTINEIDPNIIKSPLHQQALHTLQTGAPFHTQYFFEATKRWIELSVSKMDEDRLINIFMDVTNTKEAQLQLEHSLDDLKRSNENLEEFAYAASHDMKEPIRKVLMFADLLKVHLKDKLEVEDQRLLDKIEKSTKRMNELVEDLLLYSQVTRTTQLEEWVDLNKKVQLVQEDLELLIREKNAVIQADQLPTIKGHRRQLQQLFSNLINNALKYSKQDETPHIRIRSHIVPGSEINVSIPPEERHKEFYLIEVEDNGIGFNPKDAERIFNVFTRLHHNESKGTGVGLAIVRKVVENHHGYITAESQPGHGATFYVYLPVDEEA